MMTPEMEDKVETSRLCEKVQAYFQDEEHRKEFEIWYQKKYGKPYQWRN